MDQETLVAEKIDDGWRLIVQAERDGAKIAAAFWIKTGEDGQWFLYIASSLAEEDPAAAYRAVYASLRKLPENCIVQSELKLVSPANPLVQGLLSIQPRHPFLAPQRIWGYRVGGISIQAGLIYPSVPRDGVFMTRDEVKKALFDLLNRGNVVQPSTVTLQDGSSFQGVPFGIELSNNLMNAKFIDDASPMPRTVWVDDIASIQ